MRAHVAGSGIAALCTARLLRAHGWTITLSSAPARPVPHLVLDGVTVDLLRRLFDDLDSVFADAHVLGRRHVRWGARATPSIVAAPALVVAEARLVEALRAGLDLGAAEPAEIDGDGASAREPVAMPDWLVTARGRERACAVGRHRFGQRRMLVAEFQMRHDGDEATAFIETTPAGWVFMTPVGRGVAMIQGMIADECAEPLVRLEALVDATRDIRSQVAGAVGAASTFEAAPSMAERCCERGVIAVGDAAITLDPLCGDGVGFGVRGAILAAAVLDAIAQGADESSCLAHYRARLGTALARHVRACLAYYDVDHLQGAWTHERAIMRHALARLEASVAGGRGLRYGLRGTSLVPLAAAPPS